MTRVPASAATMPVVFVSHGSPMVGIDSDDYTAAIARMSSSWPTPDAIVVVSAHWQTPQPARITSSATPGVIHDFFGFPDALYRLDYPCSGAPDLAREIVAMAGAADVYLALDAKRGLDHGAWIPLRLAYPAADVPVVQISLGVPRDASKLLALGAALKPLRSRSVLLVGSGGIVHNLGLVQFADKHAAVESWSRRFDDWVHERVVDHDLASLHEYRALAPYADRAVPTTEHFDPLFFALGAKAANDRVIDIYRGFHYGNLSMQCFALQS